MNKNIILILIGIFMVFCVSILEGFDVSAKAAIDKIMNDFTHSLSVNLYILGIIFILIGVFFHHKKVK